jgi:phosphoribosyl 1,2-cyclic phosphodiesterase
MEITFRGVRGSMPVPGPETLRYGGNTPCVELRQNGKALILDAGTGLVAPVNGAPKRDSATILLTHTHWDHIQGLPFFALLYRASASVRVLGPAQGQVPLRCAVERLLAPEHFPVAPEALAGRLTVSEVTEGPFEAEGFRIEAFRLRHGAVTFGYRIWDITGGLSFSFLTDNELGDRDDTALSSWRGRLVQFLRGSDVLVHDTMLRDESWPVRRGWGHSTAHQAIELAAAAGCGRLVLYHHDPAHDDDEMDRLVDRAEECAARHAPGLNLVAAREGMTLNLE